MGASTCSAQGIAEVLRVARDKILIRDLMVRGIIGLNDWERKERQDIVVNLTVWSDLAPAGRSDDMNDSLNYRTLAKAVIAHIESSSYFLVEALATAIARIAIVELGAERIQVRIEKPGALRFANSVGVEIERERADFA